MVNMLIADGKKGNVPLPYEAVLNAFEPLWPLLEEIKEPCLGNFDMWKKNIMLKKQGNEYIIDGNIDLERAFYGAPYADFISSNTICGDVASCAAFKDNYSSPFIYTKNDRIRLQMYIIYLTLMMGAEVYRYDDADTKSMLDYCTSMLNERLEALKNEISSR